MRKYYVFSTPHLNKCKGGRYNWTLFDIIKTKNTDDTHVYSDYWDYLKSKGLSSGATFDKQWALDHKDGYPKP